MTGSRADFFVVPLAGLQALQEMGVEAWPALMEDLHSFEQIARFKALLAKQKIQGDLELESLKPYPFVLKNLQRRNIRLGGE